MLVPTSRSLTSGPRSWVAAMAAAFALSACGGISDQPEGAADPSSGAHPETPTSVTSAAAVRIVPEFAASREVTAEVGQDGATLTTDDGAGTTYVLEIPPNALPATVEISMTPVTSVAGLPDGVDWHVGVEFAPSGLQLALPGLLTIQRAGVADLEFVGYRGPEREVYLTDGRIDDDQIRLPITGFSGRGGVSCAGPCARAGLAPLPPVDPTAAYESARDAARRAGLNSQNRQLDGETVGDEIWNETLREFTRAFETLAKQCRESTDLDEIYSAVIRVASLLQVAQLIGIDEYFDDIDAQELRDECLRFEFELDARFEEGDGATQTIVEHLGTRFPLQPDADLFVGEGPLDIRDAYIDRPGLGCVVGLQPDASADGPWPVKVLAMTLIFSETPDGDAAVLDAEVLLDPGWMQMHQREPCSVEMVTILDESTLTYLSGWWELHDDEYEQISREHDYYRITGWDIRVGEVVAEKRYQRSQMVYNTWPMREDTTLSIRLVNRGGN